MSQTPFSSFNQLLKICRDRVPYVTLTTGYRIKTTKKELGKIAKAMAQEGDEFKGSVNLEAPGLAFVDFKI